MNFEKYSERSQGFLQSAQTLALREGHQRFTPEHVLKVLLDDKEGMAANLIRSAGGDPGKAQLAVNAELNKLPKVEGSGAGQLQEPQGCSNYSSIFSLRFFLARLAILTCKTNV